MAEPVICVEQLGKKYRIGKAEKKADTVTGAILNGLKSPFTNLKQIRNLSRLDKEGDTIFWALRDVSFEVQEGEVLGIIGHNGAGKSTLLKILSQITEPSTGEVKIRGRVAALLEVGTGFHPELTGRENIYMNGTILGMTKKEINRKLDEIVDFSGVEKYLDTPVKFYSSGMRVRLGFAVAAHLEPEILIIDEVLSVGDAEFQKKCLGKMEDVSKNGRTVLFVSHDLTAVQSLCRISLVLSHGKVSFKGETYSAIRNYLQSNSSDGHNSRALLSKLGNNAIIFDDFFIESDGLGKGLKIDSKRCVFNLSFRKQIESIYDLSVAITLKDQFMKPVVTFWNTLVNNKIEINSEFGIVKCMTDSIPIAAGTYTVHLWCSVNGDLSTLIEDFATIEKIDDNYFGSGRSINPKNHGYLMVKNQQWNAS